MKSIARQERLLQGLMREIVRMTAQKQPLEVGVPLYPFSSSTLWSKDKPAPGEESTGAPPLPVSQPFEEQNLPSGAAHHHHRSMSTPSSSTPKLNDKQAVILFVFTLLAFTLESQLTQVGFELRILLDSEE